MSTKKLKLVMAFGTFDIFHPGHRSFLKQARKYGDCLIVVVARDRTVEETKNQKPKNRETKRIEILKESKIPDEVILGNMGDKYAVIKKYKPDVICLGYDQKYFITGLKEKLREFGLKRTKIIRLRPYRPSIYKSSKLRERP